MISVCSTHTFVVSASCSDVSNNYISVNKRSLHCHRNGAPYTSTPTTQVFGSLKSCRSPTSVTSSDVHVINVTPANSAALSRASTAHTYKTPDITSMKCTQHHHQGPFYTSKRDLEWDFEWDLSYEASAKFTPWPLSPLARRTQYNSVA